MAETGGNDPKKLEGRPEGEEGKFLPREFFWDSVALYVVSVIIGLAAIDALTEFIRGSSVSCFVPNLGDSEKEYINNFCSASLPMTEYFPAFIVVHGILIAIPHYLWLNHYGGNFDYFFTQASQMDRTREEKTGEYSNKNRLIVQQLTEAFTTYKENWMFILYLLKLIGQLMFTVLGFIVAIFFFTDFNDVFYCPRNNATVSDEFWPLDEQVRCVFTSLRLFWVIRIADLILLGLVILCFFWSLIWSLSTHPTELGSKHVAEFSFQSSIAPKQHKFSFSQLCCQPRKGPRIKTNLDFLVLKLFRTDSGLGHIFREMQIFLHLKDLDGDDMRRTRLLIIQKQHRGGLSVKNISSELSSVSNWYQLGINLGLEPTQLRQIEERAPTEIERCKKDMVELWLRNKPGASWRHIVTALREMDGEMATAKWIEQKYIIETALIDPKEITADLQWKFKEAPKKEAALEGPPMEEAREEGPKKLEIPNSLRGAIVGFSARASKRDVALYVTFGSPSLGIASALTRVFGRVGVVNFSPYYPNPEPSEPKERETQSDELDERETEPEKLVKRKIFMSHIVYLLCHEDILSSEVVHSNQLMTEMEAVWVREGSGIAIRDAPKTDFVVVGPIDKESQKTTATLLLTKLCKSKRLKPGCVLLTVYPTMIASKKTMKEFHEYSPPGGEHFGPFKLNVQMNRNRTLNWPPSGEEEAAEENLKSSFEFDHVSCGDSPCTFRFDVYKYPNKRPTNPAAAAARVTLDLTSTTL